MPKRFRTQFLATHPEMLHWVAGWVEHWPLIAFCTTSWPKPTVTSWQGLHRLFDRGAGVAKPNRIYFFPSGVSIEGSDLVKAIEDRLQSSDWAALDLGESKPESLRESALSGYSANPDVDRIWKGLVKDIRRNTMSGGWAVNGLGVRVQVPSIRYTRGADESQRAGVVLKAFAGEVTYAVPA